MIDGSQRKFSLLPEGTDEARLCCMDFMRRRAKSLTSAMVVGTD